MPTFVALQRITEAPPGVTLRLPMPRGTRTNVSEDEAAILRGLPDLFEVEAPWTATPTRNRMVGRAAVTKTATDEAPAAAPAKDPI